MDNFETSKFIAMRCNANYRHLLINPFFPITHKCRGVLLIDNLIDNLAISVATQ